MGEGDVHPAGECRRVRVEAGPDRRSVDLESADVRSAPRTGAGEDVVAPVAVEVAAGHVDATGETGVIGEEGRRQ